MKKLITVSTLLVAMLLQAQTFKVQYTQTMDIDALRDSINSNERAKAFMSEEMMNDIFSQMAKPQNYILTYSDGKSLYEIAPEMQEEDEEEGLEVGQGRKFNWSRMLRRFSPILYKDHTNTTFAKQQGIFDKQFLIKDTLESLDWTILDTTKTFGDFTCTMATATNAQNQEVEACYTEDIPINEGPDDYYGLPGLVVEVKIGPVLVNMTEIKILEDSMPIEPPTEGKEVSSEEFKAIMKERMDAMKKNGRGMSIFH